MSDGVEGRMSLVVPVGVDEDGEATLTPEQVGEDVTRAAEAMALTKNRVVVPPIRLVRAIYEFEADTVERSEEIPVVGP